ncbi:hypothetical protein [Streptomyces sp. NPDC007905]|uniref:hypothetical protein n=1 Tax=Streptomyces sp. NPDC007905 TaxID=3364788 RepID=UPI0036F1621A
MSAEGAAVVVFDETVSGLGRVHCGSGRPDSTIGMDAAALIAAVPTAATAPVAEIRGPGAT